MRQTNKNNLIIFILTGIIAIICLFIPPALMKKQVKNTLNTASAAPSDSYIPSSVAMSRYISNQLSDFERVQLIAGGWDSTYLPAEWSELDINEATATDVIKMNLNNIYRRGEYDLFFNAEYENWYTWETSLYKAVDASFGTYLAYYTVTKFTKYDGSYVYYVIASEKGDILYAYTDYSNSLAYDTVFNSYHEDYTNINTASPQNDNTPNTHAYTYIYIPKED